MDWPASSPNCNPMKNVWRIVVRQVYANDKQFSSVEEVKRAVVTAWDNISDDMIRSFVGSMGNRMSDVIRGKRGDVVVVPNFDSMLHNYFTADRFLNKTLFAEYLSDLVTSSDRDKPGE
ncbi:unnamed protein product [Nippostrongylus brasiliensis]|uniref:DDE-1 domain-containing protein n=1 Tax=Nippostrongylus brasiliensis TaxID=27835 RepID=A0A0N4Y467_NIPBR|nr:unnamed protein product [Nippostrongylus brasiliensis]